MAARSKVNRKFQTLLAERAALLRSRSTVSESALWLHLRSSQLGVAFRRQVPLGRHIADFAAPSIRLVVEVDGGYHLSHVAADARKDQDLARLGYRVLRLEAELVMSPCPRRWRAFGRLSRKPWPQRRLGVDASSYYEHRLAMWLLGLIADRLAICRLRRENAVLRREKALLLEEMRIKDAAYARWEAEQSDTQQHAARDAHDPVSVDQ